MESDQDIATTVLGFLSTFNEGSVGMIGIIGTIRRYGNRRDSKANRIGITGIIGIKRLVLVRPSRAL
jgi:hypothetical protein